MMMGEIQCGVMGEGGHLENHLHSTGIIIKILWGSEGCSVLLCFGWLVFFFGMKTKGTTYFIKITKLFLVIRKLTTPNHFYNKMH